MDFGEINRQSQAWPYEQVLFVLAAAIESGELAPGQRLPSMEHIAQMAGVSKTAVRNALAVLREQGKIVTVPRLGTFVAERKPG